jgi:hypothetical protein
MIRQTENETHRCTAEKGKGAKPYSDRAPDRLNQKKTGTHSADGPTTVASMPPLTPCYAIVLPGPKSAFGAAFRPDFNRKASKFGPPAEGRPEDRF